MNGHEKQCFFFMFFLCKIPSPDSGRYSKSIIQVIRGHWSVETHHGLAHQDHPPHFSWSQRRNLSKIIPCAAPGSSKFDGARQELRRDLASEAEIPLASMIAIGVPLWQNGTPPYFLGNCLSNMVAGSWLVLKYIHIYIYIYVYICLLYYIFALVTSLGWFALLLVFHDWPMHCWATVIRLQVPGYAVFANTWLSNHVARPKHRFGGLQTLFVDDCRGLYYPDLPNILGIIIIIIIIVIINDNDNNNNSNDNNDNLKGESLQTNQKKWNDRWILNTDGTTPETSLDWLVCRGLKYPETVGKYFGMYRLLAVVGPIRTDHALSFYTWLSWEMGDVLVESCGNSVARGLHWQNSCSWNLTDAFRHIQAAYDEPRGFRQVSSTRSTRDPSYTCRLVLKTHQWTIDAICIYLACSIHHT